MNALTHGLFSERIVLPDEDPSHFARFRDAVYEQLLPSGIDELVLFEKIVSLSWRLRRVQRYSNSARLSDLERISRHEQRLEFAIRGCENDFVKLRRRTQKPNQTCAAQPQTAPKDANTSESEAMGKRYQIERFEPTAIDGTSFRAV